MKEKKKWKPPFAPAVSTPPPRSLFSFPTSCSLCVRSESLNPNLKRRGGIRRQKKKETGKRRASLSLPLSLSRPF